MTKVNLSTSLAQLLLEQIVKMGIAYEGAKLGGAGRGQATQDN